MPQQYPTARESPREFSRASGAMMGAQHILLAVDNILAHLMKETQVSLIAYDAGPDMQDMLDETVSCQTQTLAKLEKIKHKLCDH